MSKKENTKECSADVAAPVAGSSAQSTNTEVARVSTKLPAFWEDSPDAWFAAAEAEFEVSQITRERTRYSYLIGALPKEVLKKVMDIITQPPAEDPYSHLKAQLLERLTISEEQRISQLLYHVQMGDRSPSDFYRYMTQVAGNSANLTTELIRKLWLARLPKTIEVTLIALESRETQELLKIADKLWDATQAGAVSGIENDQYRNSRSFSDSETDSLRREIGELRDMIKKISRQSRSKSRHDNNTCNFKGSRNRSVTKKKQYPTCYYHYRFGDQANKCVQPCNFLSQKRDNTQQQQKN